MKNKFIFLLIIIFGIIALPFAVKSFDDEKNNGIIIKYKKDKKLEQVSEKYDVDKDKVNEIDELNIFKVDDPTLWQKFKIYIDKAFGGQIEYIESDSVMHALSFPNDIRYQEQWALPKISAPGAWDVTRGSGDVIIAIVDSGINGTHEDLIGKLTEGYNILENIPISSNSDSDDFGHGTSVAGVASAATDNVKGIAGVSWQTKLMPVKVISSQGTGYSFDVAAGIIYAVDHGARIVNLSLGGSTLSNTLKSAIDYAYDQKNSLVVAASGNSNTVVSYPAGYWKVLAVGASNSSDERWWKSNYGAELDVIAPGENVLTPLDNGSYSSRTGTSFSSPHVCGLAALLLAKDSSYSNKKLKSIIENSTDKLPQMGGSDRDDYYGYGRINAYKALTSGSLYHAQVLSKNSDPVLTNGQAYNFHVTIKNTGSIAWTKDTVFLETDIPAKRITQFLRSNSENESENSNWTSENQIGMSEETVSPGSTATFSFWMSVPSQMSKGTYRENFRLVTKDGNAIEDSEINWNINILTLEEAYYPCELVSKNASPTLYQGSGYNFFVKIRNKGIMKWEKNKIFLATDKPQNRISSFVKGDLKNQQVESNWVNDNRIKMIEDVVYPGEVATFSFWMSAPENLTPKNYQEFFRLLADEVTWMQDLNVEWNINVIKSTYQSQFIFQSPYPTVSDGQTAAMTVAYKNTGTATWRKGTVNLGTVDSSFNWKLGGYDLSYNWLSSNRPTSLDQDTVAPGEIGTFTFQIKNNGASQGNHRLDVGLVAEGITWFGSNTHAYWDVNVPVNYSAQFVSQSNYVTINEGETKSMTISYRNTGSSVWRRGVVNLGTVDADYNWIFSVYPLSHNWVSVNRPALLDQDTVAPGEIGTFTFQLKNNGIGSNNFRLFVGLVAEGITWFNRGTHAFWDVISK